jgi:Spy/CpxP family protein refolding chaperone
MKKVILGTLISLALTACSNGATGISPNTFGLVAKNASTTADVTTATGTARGGFKDHKGGDFKGGDFGGMFKDLNLTADQQAKLKALRDSQKPVAPAVKPAKPTAEEIQKMKDAQKAIETAFTGDKLDATTLKGLLDAARPANNKVAPDQATIDAHLTARANDLLQTYNIFTPEQRQKLEDAKKQMEAKMATMKDDAKFKEMEANRVKKQDEMLAKFNLNADQKAAFLALQPAKADFAAMDAKRKAADDAIQAELKSGNATVDSLKAILAKNEPDRTAEQATRTAAEATRIDAIVKLHDVLTADQRKQMVQFVLGHFGGKGGPGFGGKGGFKGGEGFGGKGGHGPTPVAPPAGV